LILPDAVTLPLFALLPVFLMDTPLLVAQVVLVLPVAGLITLGLPSSLVQQMDHINSLDAPKNAACPHLLSLLDINVPHLAVLVAAQSVLESLANPDTLALPQQPALLLGPLFILDV